MKSRLKHSVLPKRRLESFEAKLDAYVGGIAKRMGKADCCGIPEASVLIAGDARYQREILKPLAKFGTIDHLILVGIGGSNLGTEAVYEALRTPESPTLTVLDQIDREALESLRAFVKKLPSAKKLALVVVSKSGTTTETVLNAVKAIEICERRFGETFRERTIFIGDTGTALSDIARRRGVLFIPMPAVIGGRYSVFTAVGIVPLALLGIDVGALRRGATGALRTPHVRETKEAGATLALSALQGTHTVNFFTFGKRLETIGFWYRQLLAESIGKEMTTKGATFSHQILPIVSTAVDLHSMAQLFFSGYDGLYTHLLSVSDSSPYKLPGTHWLFEHLPFLSHKRVGEVSDAIVAGVVRAYDEKELPYRKTELPGLSAYEVGLLMNSLMLEVMCVAHLLHVNAFNQPAVELYKKHTRNILAG